MESDTYVNSLTKNSSYITLIISLLYRLVHLDYK